MSLSRLALALVLAPSLALAQGFAGAGTARRTRVAGEQAAAGDDARKAAADAASGAAASEPAPLPPPADLAPPADLPPPPHIVSGVEIDDGTAEDATGPDGVAPAETYTVQRGDTLWDLSAKFLNSPWYWPRLWSYNPQIANPHWIYPGNVVRFYPGGDGKPPRIEVAGSEPERSEPAAAPQPADDDVVTVGGRYKIGYVPPKGVHARRDSFVTPEQVAESGVISAAFEEKLLLSIQDRAYARFSDPKAVRPGATYVLYTKDGEIRHPRTGELFGYKTTVIGAARVVSVDDHVATIEIVRAYDPIERGTLIGPWTDAFMAQRQIRERKNDHELSGFIIATQQDLVSEIGEHHVVFVDKGTADGVEEGNVFTVVRSGDPYGQQRPELLKGAEDLPEEDVGALMIIDAQKTSSAALVVRSLRELFVGDRVEMRLAKASTR